MKITAYTKPKSIITLGLALLLIVDPTLLFRWVNLPLGDGGMLLGRTLGLVYFGIGLNLWFIRGIKDLSSRDAWVFSLVDALAAGLFINAQLTGMMNVLAWALVATYVSSALGFSWCARHQDQQAA